MEIVHIKMIDEAAELFTRLYPQLLFLKLSIHSTVKKYVHFITIVDAFLIAYNPSHVA